MRLARILILCCLAMQSAFAAEPIGYVWPNNTLLLTNSGPLSFKPLQNGGFYPLLFTLESGYSIVCEGKDGQRHAALLPLVDRLGKPLTIEASGNDVIVSSRFIILDKLDWVDLKPGVIQLEAGKKYPVIGRTESKFSVLFSTPVFAQIVQIAEADADFLTVTEYKAAIDSLLDALKEKAAEQIEANHFSNVGTVFRSYKGRFAEDTVDVRGKLAAEFEAKAAQAKRKSEMQYEAEQRAKGLVKFRSEWITPEEKTKREQREQEEAAQQERYEAEQKARGLIKYRGSWMTPEQSQAIYQQEQQARDQAILEQQRTKQKAEYEAAHHEAVEKIKKEAIEIAGKVEQIMDDGALISEARMLYTYEVEIVRPDYRPMEMNRVFVKKTGSTPIADEYQPIFVIGAGGGFTDGAKWTAIAYPAGTYRYTTVTGAGKTVKCFALSPEDAVNHILSSR